MPQGNGRKAIKMVALGVGVVVFAPLIARATAAAARPLLKSAIKGGLILAEKGKVALAESMETIEDMTAEARAELAAEGGAGHAEESAPGAEKRSA